MKPCKLIIALVALSAFCVGASAARAQLPHGSHKQDKKKAEPGVPKCPVMGDPVDFSVKVAASGGPVYFCCQDCIEKYQANPKKYSAKVAEQRKAVAALPKVQVACPVTGKPPDKGIFVKRKGRKVYFCCEDCPPKFKKAPKKYKGKLADSYTYQTKCPVMDGDINPHVFSTLPDGRKVFHCCPGCEKPFLKDPAKYAAHLGAQGMKIDPDKILAGKKGKHDKHDDHGSHGHGHHGDDG